MERLNSAVWRPHSSWDSVITACSKSPVLSLPCPQALGLGASPRAPGVTQPHRPIQVCPVPPATRADSAGQHLTRGWCLQTPSCFSGCFPPHWVGCDARGLGLLFSSHSALGFLWHSQRAHLGLVQVEKEHLEHRVEKLIFHFCEEKSKSSLLV